LHNTLYLLNKRSTDDVLSTEYWQTATSTVTMLMLCSQQRMPSMIVFRRYCPAIVCRLSVMDRHIMHH